MKRTVEMKLLSIALALIMVFVCYIAMPAKALAEEAEEAEQTEAIEAYAEANLFSQDNRLAYSPLAGELPEERDESAKVFRRADGAQEMVLYGDPVHYLRDGKWEAIDNTLKLVNLEDGAQAYRNKASDFTVSFAPSFDAENLVTIESAGHTLSWRFAEWKGDEQEYDTIEITDAEAEVTAQDRKEPETDEERDMLLRYPEELTSELTYKDPETGLNVHYVLSGKRLSEQIVLDHAPETAIAYSTLLTTNGLKAEEKDGRIVFVDESGEAIFEIMPPVMYDANGEESIDIEVRLTETEDGYSYTLIPNEKWLTDEARAYPVTIDPDVEQPFAGNVVDTYVDSSSPNANYSSSESIYASVSAYRALIKINLPTLKSGDIVLNATMHLAKRNEDPNYLNILVTGHQITDEWNVGNVTYNTLPTFETEASTLASAARENYMSDFDITTLAKGWHDGSIDNYGILLKADGYVKFYSSEYSGQTERRPSLSIVYRNSTGLEGNWTYYSQSAGRAGTGSVNLASGNLTWTLSDGGITNGALPISLSHVYNANDVDFNYGYGRGWRLNYTQTLKRFPVVNGNTTTLYYEYTDGDGTRHYYKYQDGEYINELDKDSKLTFNVGGTEATITDKGDNKLVFQVFTSGSGDTLQKNGRLIEIEDANGNKTEITYKNPTGWSLRISKITEHLNGASTGQELTLSYYESNNYLQTISAPNGLDITFTYSIYDDLASATYTGGESVTFNYSDHRLAKITNIDGYNLRYIYNRRNGIRQVTEYTVIEDNEGPAEIEGQSLLFGYGRNKTVVTDSQNRKTVYMLDSLGKPISVTDTEGRAMYAAYNTAEQTVTQMSAVSKLQYTVVNLLQNHGFEQSSSSPTNWTTSGTGISIDSTERREGRRSVQFASASGTRTLSQTVSVVSGETYTLSAYFKGSGQGQMNAVTGSSTFNGDPITATADDWTRAAVTFKATSNSATVSIVVPANSGTLHADSVQLEKTAAPNRYNMLENSDFSNGTTGYTRNYTTSTGVVTLPSANASNHPAYLGNKVFQFNLIDHEAYIAQTVTVDGHAGDVYSFGAWMQSACPTESSQWFNYGSGSPPSIHKETVGIKRLSVEFLNSSDQVVAGVAIAFAVDTREWQFASGAAVAPCNYYKVRIKASVNRCIGTTLVDGLQLYRETFSQAYSYDSNGNLTGYTSLIGQENSFEYDNHDNIEKSTDPRGNETTYTYDTKHNVTSVTSPSGVKAKYDYNAKGQVWRTRVGTDTTYIETLEEHGNAAAQLTKVIDSRGKEVVYTYDDTRLTKTITDPNGNTTEYTNGEANEMFRLKKIKAPDGGTVKYTYDAFGVLETIEVGENVTENGVTNWQVHNTYFLTYDEWNRPEKTKVGTVTLSTNTYYDDGKLKKVEYSNDLMARYVYDSLDRVSRIYQTEGNNQEELTYEMVYNGEGDLYELRNYRTKRVSFFEYDHAGRCMASKERAFTFTVNNGIYTIQSYDTVLSSYGYQYDECNHLSKLTCSVAGSTWSTVYTYDDDNRPSTTTLSSGKVITNTYDTIGRLTNRVIGLPNSYITVIGYLDVSSEKKTALVESYQNGIEDPYEYEYDDNGNITEITQGSTSITYKYDVANRLIRENNGALNQTVTYAYDSFGNIKSKTVYAYTTAQNPGTPIDTIGYTYNSTGWADQLTQYGNETISYDSMGNPLTYRGYSMTWRGKQLTSASNGTDTITFEYNEDGLRQQKKVNNVDTDYFYNGSVLIGMQKGNDKLLFSYDASGNVVSVKYITANDTNEYYYLRNAQGDIVKLIDASGNTVVEYTYDTWGKKVSTTGTLAGTLGLFQPFRYRGYVYDEETGLYYLQSRYYDPDVGRFISADILLSTGQGVMGHNSYAYCLDNPIICIDISGCDCYIFYLSEWEEEALSDQMLLMERYGFDKSEVHAIEIVSKEQFLQEWKDLADKSTKVDAMVILTHGNPKCLGNGKGSDKLGGWTLTSSEISELKPCEVGWLLLIGCNAGHVDYANENPANAFAGVTSGRVYASDGTVYPRKSNNLGGHQYSAEKDPHFKNWNDSRDPIGWVYYYGGQGQYTVLNNTLIVVWNGTLETK